MKVSVCQYPMEILPNWESYIIKIETWIKQARNQGADLFLFPEYAGIEIICKTMSSDRELYEQLQPLIPRYLNEVKTLAQKYQMYIVLGSLMVAVTAGYANRAFFFSPDGEIAYQDKLQLIEYEKNDGLIQSGSTQTLFETTLGKIGIAICYDSEFPEIVRKLVLEGADIILVPSYTVSLAGYNRVFLSCRARAIENQCYVAVSYVIGSVNLSGDSENTVGQAAILSPIDSGFPDDGIMAKGKMNESIVITEDLSLSKLAAVREQGAVKNFFDSQKFNSSHINFRKVNL